MNNTKVKLNPFIQNEIKRLTKQREKSKRKYRILAIVVMFLNLTMIGVAAAAIDLLITYHSHHSGDSEVGIVLTSAAATIVILLFFVQFSITIYRSRRKTDIYSTAIDEIHVEVVKYQEGIGEYKRKAKEKLLEEKVESIKEEALHDRHNTKLSTILLKSMTGDADA